MTTVKIADGIERTTAGSFRFRFAGGEEVVVRSIDKISLSLPSRRRTFRGQDVEPEEWRIHVDEIPRAVFHGPRAEVVEVYDALRMEAGL